MGKERYDYQEQAQKVWSMYQKGIDYQETMGLSSLLPQCVKFFEGEQWAKPTEKTKTLPRPVINVTKMIGRNKKAGVLSNKTSIIYSCKDASVGKKFTNFSNFTLKKANFDEVNRKAMESAIIKGTYIYYVYYDADVVGQNGKKRGGLKFEIIDPLDIFFENPNNSNEQEQKWIIIRKRVSVGTVKKMKDKEVDETLITSDRNDSTYNEKEQDEDALVTLLTRFFKKDGEVYYEKSIKGTIINKEKPLAPDIEKAKKMLNIEEDEANEQGSENPSGKNNPKAWLYPIAVGSWDTRDNSIFGIGEVEGIMPTQKAINFNLALQLLNVQSVWGGKWLVHPQALRNQTITNDPSQVLIDYSNTGNGIKKVTEQVYNDVPLKIQDSMISMLRVVTGATEVMTGETIGANTSGSAILQLQSQALKPIEEYQQSFWCTLAKLGKVLEMFYKIYFDSNETFYYKQEIDGIQDNQYIEDKFNGADYLDEEFDINVDVIAGSKGSEVSQVNALEMLVQKGQIDIKTFFELYPHNALPNKNEIIQKLNELETSKLKQLEQTVEQQSVQLQNASAVFEQSKETIQNAVNILQENQRLKEMIVNLRGEFANKINMANEKIKETTSDATMLAKSLFNEQQKHQVNQIATGDK